jgi:beta-glucosidase
VTSSVFVPVSRQIPPKEMTEDFYISRENPSFSSMRGVPHHSAGLQAASLPSDEDGSGLRSKEELERMIANMTTMDLIGQMSQVDIGKLLYQNSSSSNDGKTIVNQTALDYYIGERGIGSVYSIVESSVIWTAETLRSIAVQIQETAKRYDRPPVIWGIDSIHGANYIYGAIVTPQPINLAATFNASVPFIAGRLASRDTRAAGLNWIFSPLIGLALEPRWSRFYETFGEDPYVVGVMASNLIQGIQYYNSNASRCNGTDALNGIPSRAAACAKHFLGYSKPQNGRDRSPSWIPTRHLYQYFVPPWKRVVHPDTNVLTVMESYTETDGVPMVANKATLNYLLRQRLNFSGVLLTDFDEIEHLFSWHHVAKNGTDAVSYALSQGSVDVSMIPWNAELFADGIQSGLQSKVLTVERLRESVFRVLDLKDKLRMFDETLEIYDPSMELIGTDEGAALDMIHQSLVLVKNDGGLLPLSTSFPINRLLNILVTGPTANSRIYQSGGWTYHWESAPNENVFTYGTTVLDAFSRHPAYNVTFACGTDIIGKPCEENESISQAVEASQWVDVVIICVGEESYAEKPGDLVRDDLHLPDGQYELVESIASHLKDETKMLLVYFGGRPRLLGPMVDNVDAIVIGFLPGPGAGDGLLDVVSGDVNPSGRLPITYPAVNGGGFPYFHSVSDQCVVGDGQHPFYEYNKCAVQWPFGHGLSYTTFEYSGLTATSSMDRFDRNLHVSVTVTNTGTVAGAESVLFFTFDEYRRTTPEYKRLRAFHKVFLQPNEEIIVNVTISADELRFVGPHDDHHFVTDPLMTFWVGVGSSTDCRSSSSDVTNDSLCVYFSEDNVGNSLESIDSSHYVGVCDSACSIWINESPCASYFSLTFESCLSKCTSINEYSNKASDMVRDGWGWDYVSCIESVTVGFQRSSFDPKSHCWKMTALCRDIFRTDKMDEYGMGPLDNSSIAFPPLSYILALLAGLVSSLFFMYSLRKRSGLGQVPRPSDHHDNDDPGCAPYHRLEESDQEKDRQLIEDTMSLLGLD